MIIINFGEQGIIANNDNKTKMDQRINKINSHKSPIYVMGEHL
jgi:hypothetical protein